MRLPELMSLVAAVTFAGAVAAAVLGTLVLLATAADQSFRRPANRA
jgi:hypothetical protein